METSVNASVSKMQSSVIDEDNIKKKKIVQSQVLQILKSTGYSLSAVNRYKENIVHLCAANGCIDVLKDIVRNHGMHSLQRKNIFGWTPIMHAIRNQDVPMVKFLLSCDAVVNDFSFLGLSILSLASAVSSEIFDLLYNNNPSALSYAAHDDINPLFIAALKNDEKLFFKLIRLGFNPCKSNPFTLAMMKQSLAPRIRDYTSGVDSLHTNSEDYWDDVSDIEHLLVEQVIPSVNSQITNSSLTININIPNLIVENINSAKISPSSRLNKNQLKIQVLQTEEEKVDETRSISPLLSYNNKFPPPASPNIFAASSDSTLSPNSLMISFNFNANNRALTLGYEIQPDDTVAKEIDPNFEASLAEPLALERCQDSRPPNLKLSCSSDDSNVTLSFTPQFSPPKTPNLPKDTNENHVFDELTPTPPKYETPPRGIIFDDGTKKLVRILRKYGLARHIPVFIEQEEVMIWRSFMSKLNQQVAAYPNSPVMAAHEHIRIIYISVSSSAAAA